MYQLYHRKTVLLDLAILPNVLQYLQILPDITISGITYFRFCYYCTQLFLQYTVRHENFKVVKFYGPPLNRLGEKLLGF